WRRARPTSAAAASSTSHSSTGSLTVSVIRARFAALHAVVHSARNVDSVIAKTFVEPCHEAHLDRHGHRDVALGELRGQPHVEVVQTIVAKPEPISYRRVGI